MSEDQLQSKCFIYFHNTYSNYRNLFFAVPNGGKRDIREAMKLKATGVIAGIPDMILLHSSTCIGFEFKAEKGVLSDSQKKIHKIWNDNNYKVFVIKSFEEFVEIIEKVII